MKGKVCKRLSELASMVAQGGNQKGFIKDTMKEMSGMGKDGKIVEYKWGTLYTTGPRRVYKSMKKAISSGYPLKQIEIDVARILAGRERQEASNG